ncbi:MAG TPA: NRDE family protein [Burkholderiales bacterium]|nr:NRDE family protein [Burkholderiales bacterium]
MNIEYPVTPHLVAMCLILLAWRTHPEFSLVFGGNRDEAYERPSAAAAFWTDDPRVFGGRDLEKGGTWLGITREGRMAAVTNYRDGSGAVAARSRGELTAGFLRGGAAPRAYLEEVEPYAQDHRGYTLIVGDHDQLFAFSNRGGRPEALAPGLHGVSNHLPNTPWPKVVRGKQRLNALLKAGEAELAAGLFEALADRTVASDADLPDSGVGLQRERELSPAFIAGERYGTRATTVILVGRRGDVMVVERRFGPRGALLGETSQRFALQRRAAVS